MDKYLKNIRKIIILKSGLEPDELHEDSFFEDDLNISKMELLDIITAIEEEYHIEFEDDEKENLETVRDLIDAVIEKVE